MKMDYVKFEELFVRVATVWTNSLEVARAKAGAYYKTLEQFPYDIFEKVCAQVVDESPPKLPLPREFLQRCYNEKNSGRSEDMMSPLSKDITQTPSALRARREFYEKIASLYDPAAEERFCASTAVMGKAGMKTLGFAITRAIILEPDARQREYEKKEAERRRVQKRADFADGV